jgi:hypothetical protein
MLRRQCLIHSAGVAKVLNGSIQKQAVEKLDAILISKDKQYLSSTQEKNDP